MQVKLIDIFKRLVSYDKKLEVYKNGEDNNYPERIDRLINNSVTAKTASNIMTQFLIGKGLGQYDNIKVGSDLTLLELAKDIAPELVDHKGVFIHVNYNLNFDITSAKVLPFNQCRLGKKDSKKYNGKILVKTDWSDTKEDAIAFDVFNDNADVIQSQINTAVSIDKYKGQIFYYNLDKRYFYPYSRIDAIQEDCDSERQSAIYKNQLLRKGFFGRTICITRPLIDDNISQYIINDNGDSVTNPEYRKAVSEATDVKNTIEEFLGAENAGGAMLMEMDFAGDKLDEAILFKNIESNINPDLFNNVEDSLRSNILIAFNNLPIDLVKLSTGLSNSGEAVKQNKLLYWENTTKERNTLEFILNKIMNRFNGFEMSDDIKIQPLIIEDGNEAGSTEV